MGFKQNSNLAEQELKKRLKQLLEDNRLSLHKQFIQNLAQEMRISVLDYAAALSLLNHPDILNNQSAVEKASVEKKNQQALVHPFLKQRQVRYRLDIGRKHDISSEQIVEILIEVSGVEKQRIGRLDIRKQYTLVDLPEGMPADIFHLLSEAEINQRKLNIKRLKYPPRYNRRNNKRPQKRNIVTDN